MVEAAEGVGGSVKSGTEGIGRGLSAKVGPLPVWGWLAVLGVGGAAAYFLVLRKGTGGTAYSGFGFPTGGGGGGGDGGGGTPTIPSNSAWLASAISGTAKGLGLSEAEVAYYLREYLAGGIPTGNTQAYSVFQKVIDYANQNFGQPPIAPTAGTAGASYYTTQQNWFNDVLAFLPSGTSASVIQELQALFSGTTTTISQDAADAYNAAVGIIGLGPTGGLSFTIGTTPGGTTNPPTGLFTGWFNQLVAQYFKAPVSAQNANTWADLFNTITGLPRALGHWLNAVGSTYYQRTGQYLTEAQFNQIAALWQANPNTSQAQALAALGITATGGAGWPGPSR